MKKRMIRDWLVVKLGGVKKADRDAIVNKLIRKVEDTARQVHDDKIAYAKAADALIIAKKMLRVYPGHAKYREFTCQFMVDERLIWDAFDAGNDAFAIEIFSERIGRQVYHIIRQANFIRPVEYRKDAEMGRYNS